MVKNCLIVLDKMLVTVNSQNNTGIEIPDEYVSANGMLDLAKLGKIDKLRKISPDLADRVSFWFHELVYYNHRIENPSSLRNIPSILKEPECQRKLRTAYDDMKDDAMRSVGFGMEPDWDAYDKASEQELYDDGIDPYAGLM